MTDLDHAGDLMIQRSQTGILIFGNSAPLFLVFKEISSTFGAKFVALRIATELILLLQYKLRMYGIPVNEPANLFCDNKAIYKITPLLNPN